MQLTQWAVSVPLRYEVLVYWCGVEDLIIYWIPVDTEDEWLSAKFVYCPHITPKIWLSVFYFFDK